MRTSIILPIVAVLVGILLVSSSVMAESAADTLKSQLNQIAELPAGTEFTLAVTEDDATKIVGELLDTYRSKINEYIKKFANVSLDIDDPAITFDDNLLSLSLSAGKGFLKAKAEVQAELTFDGSRFVIKTKTVKVPLVSLDPSTVDGYLQPVVDQMMPSLFNQYDVRSFAISEGQVSVTALKK